MRQAILFIAHKADSNTARSFRKLLRGVGDYADVFLLLNVPEASQTKTVPRSLQPLGPIVIGPRERAQLDHPSRTMENEHWAALGDPAPGDPDRGIIAFHRLFPNYDFYWGVEYDTEFTGHWRDFFASFEKSRSDILCTNCYRYDVNPQWRWWNNVTPEVPIIERIRGFFPLFRVSNAGIRTLDAHLRDGWEGMYEVTWPTIITKAGLNLEDVGGDGEFVRPENRNRWYRSNLRAENLSPGTFVYRPARPWPGAERNKLWHPIKRQYVSFTTQRLYSKLKELST